MSESEGHSSRQISEELDRIEARLDDILIRSEMLTSEINALADKIKFYTLITESWTDEEYE
jgi:archaellum component FlaC